jgi:hypothetical protein
MSSRGVSGIPNSAQGGQFGTSDKNVVALKIKPNNPFELEGVLSPLAADKGLVFPYTPTLQVGHATNYGTYDITHTIYQPQYYVSTANPTISITANFTANDRKEARHTAAAIQFLKACTKSDFGEGSPTTAGTPPPILSLWAYAGTTLHAKSTPVVVRSINYTMPEDVNYVECEYGVIPTMMLIAVELSVQMSPRTVRKDFNINSYAKGGLLGGGNTGGFM